MSTAYSEQLQKQGFCIVPGVLAPSEVVSIRAALIEAAEETERRGQPTFIEGLDPNAANVRVFNLLDLSPVFRELILHPDAVSLVTSLIGEHYLISNFTANVARPGSKSMAVHADQAIVIPPPWHAPWAINIMWCLDDIHPDNGATLYLPGSHKVTCIEDLPPDPREMMRPFTASAGSIIAMDGRVWHTSGENVTDDEERALLFGYYTTDFIRQQVNWNVLLSDETKAALTPELSFRLGLGAGANFRHGNELTKLVSDNN